MKINAFSILISMMVCLSGNISTQAQTAVTLSLPEAIRIGKKQSYSAIVARLNYMSAYWSWRSYRAQFLPVMNLYANLMQYDHSTVQTRNSETGEIKMVDNNSLSNSITLSIDQNIAPLGGTLSVQSYFYRLDQFNYDTKTYNTQPLRLSYSQPLFAFNSLKWQKRTEPLKYDKARRTYLESMETVAQTVVNYYFSLLSAQSNLKLSHMNLKDRERLFAISEKRLKLGSITKSDLLQMELSLQNAQMDVRSKELALSTATFNLLNYLVLPIGTQIHLTEPSAVPEMALDEADVLERALANSTFMDGQKLEKLEARKTLAQAKAARGVQMRLNVDVGFNRTANHLRDAYRNLENSQVVGLTISAPIFDWGVSKGRVRMAEADLEALETSQMQAYEQYTQDLRTLVMKFNMQQEQCTASRRAREIASERYEIMRLRFEAGGVSVTELNTAWQESESAGTMYINQLSTYWSCYYALQKATLHDWRLGHDLSVDYETLIKK